MSLITLSPNAAGTGTFTIASPNSNTNRTLNLPDASGTFLMEGASQSPTFGTVTATTTNTTSLAVNGNNISAVNSLGFRNRIINGDMRIDQRNAGASVNTNGAFPVDRFKTFRSGGAATYTAQRSSVAPAGFRNSLLYTIGTGAAPGATDVSLIQQPIEGFNTSDFMYGTASAINVTLSFWVRSSVTGTFGFSFRNSDANRSYVGSYSISAANTWEYKSVTVPGDTTGSWETGNLTGIILGFDLGVGSSLSTTAGSWQSGNLLGLTGGTKLAATTGATFQITGVQLEAGSIATPFERRDYGRELMMCQRYFWRDANLRISGIAQANISDDSFTVMLPVTMRAVPTVPKLSGGSLDSITLVGTGGSPGGATGNVNATYATSIQYNIQFSAGGTTIAYVRLVNATGTASAEL